MDKQPLSTPHDFEAEQALLGVIIYENEKITDVMDIIKASSFHADSHQLIYMCSLELFEEGKQINEILIGDRLKSIGKLEEVGSYPYLAELAECAVFDAKIEYFAHIIKDHATLRDLINATTEIGRKARDPKQNVSELLAEADSKISDLFNDEVDDGTQQICDILPGYAKNLEILSENPEKLPGIQTGFRDIDRLLGGLIAPNLYILAARPAMGKSALATNIAENVAVKSGIPVLVFSMEMSNEQNTGRVVSSNSKVNNHKLKTGNLRQEDWDKLSMSFDRLSSAPIFFNNKAKTAKKVVHTVKSFVRKYGKCLVIVDYLQLMKGENKYREQEVAEMSRSMKTMASDLGIPVIALSQLNRALESRSDKRPMISDLRESGSLEQDADIIMFIYRDDVYKEKETPQNFVPTNIAEIIIAKHRDGPTGIVELEFVGKYTKFYDISQQESF